MLIKVKELLGKPVISIYDGKIEGYVNNVAFDKKLNKLKGIQFFNDDTQEELFTFTTNIYKVGEDAITIKNSADMLLANTLNIDNINPINFEVFSIYGKLISKLTDVEIDNFYKVNSIVLQNNDILKPADILNLGNNVMLIKDTSKNIKLCNFKKQTKIIPNSKNNILVEIQQDLPLLNTVVNPIPTKLTTNNYSFLIGRKVDKNIYADNKELIIKKQSKITNTVIDIACKYGKLKDLTISSLA